jgi:CHAT domain-containing protein
VPEVPGQAPLPSADLEADLVAERFPGAEVLRGEEATRDAVIDGMSRHNTVHFACHATSDPTEPSRSTLVLHDYASRPLTPLFMSRHRLDDMHLAYLSACSTTRTSELLREESIHLSSAFQLSGFRTVIGTLWPLNDAVAVRVVRQFYAGLGGEAGGSAAVALHRSVRLLRDERPDRPDLWAGLVHIGT